ncbi:sugar-binding protein [Colwellia sp. MT41]|uniref:sugar-binding protein n=1 Tax=Colwellia sp. MT41 TaxID=58049 RepID=UPI000717A4D5|nr:sugar-binding protein [Colwellia sp. MT41]ALO35504.1 sugar-binding protein [Colwellia sp. MT41]
MRNYIKFISTLLMLCSIHVSALEAVKAVGKMNIDGIADEVSWQLAKWQPIDKLIFGTQPSAADFSGRFKIMWDEEQLYLLVEITDDILFDQHADPRHLYWHDDCLEVFIDEDGSGGNHQFNFNAFAYHIALDNQVVDIGEKNADGSDNFVLLNDHITSKWRRSEKSPHKVIWELAVRVYDDSFTMQMQMPMQTNTQKKKPQPVKLSLGKELGFMLAYCDNDGSKEREHFIGSVDIQAVNGNKNLGYINADVFQKLTLIN